MNKLFRSRRDSKLTGLCGGLAEQLNVDSTVLRLVAVVTTFFSGGTLIPIYIIASVVVPKEPLSNIPPMYPPYGGGPAGMNPTGAYGPTAYGAPQQGGAFRPQPHYYGSGPSAPAPKPVESTIDDMMKDVEKKAMWKEIEELRAKVAKYEKGE
ncbi:PspC domain-containing protein [Gorillibacterium sp. sgz5001074]|uniref:PspC domain-containing protein n=1 Tax=Gorillibacterium sp. sgz5001074 TaxID=3446695 RepID=UPI003F66B34E